MLDALIYALLPDKQENDSMKRHRIYYNTPAHAYNKKYSICEKIHYCEKSVYSGKLSNICI